VLVRVLVIVLVIVLVFPPFFRLPPFKDRGRARLRGRLKICRAGDSPLTHRARPRARFVLVCPPFFRLPPFKDRGRARARLRGRLKNRRGGIPLPHRARHRSRLFRLFFRLLPSKIEDEHEHDKKYDWRFEENQSSGDPYYTTYIKYVTIS
jgi:hypothetical protein